MLHKGYSILQASPKTSWAGAGHQHAGAMLKFYIHPIWSHSEWIQDSVCYIEYTNHFFISVLEIEVKALHMPGKHPTTEL